MVDERLEGRQETAVLFSGGLDSAVLVADEATRRVVLPIYVATGLAWEATELGVLATLLAAQPFVGRVRPLARLDVDMRDVFPPSHWAVRGAPPAYDTPDEDVFLEGRNIVLLSKASVLCARRGIGRIAIGPLAGNPFPDATSAFFAAMAQALSLGLARPIDIVAPFANLRKEEVIVLGMRLGVPLEFTRSCMNPNGHAHCGRCSKCRERQQAFVAAGVADPTVYGT
jgi:7-cyano-7-deazaguanine synthase